MINFIVVEPNVALRELTPGCCYLQLDTSWNDWFKYQTSYNLIIIDINGRPYYPGIVKIAAIGMDTTQSEVSGSGKYSSPILVPQFNTLPENFFSLGQSENYYETIRAIGEDFSREFFASLNDLAFNPELIDRVQHLDVYSDSVARYIDRSTITTKFANLAQGIVQLTPFSFKYRSTTDRDFTPYEVEFNVNPYSKPPTNLHTIIGRNGVGKTHCLRHMALSIVNPQSTSAGFSILDGNEIRPFTKVISVSFSVFDPFLPVETSADSNIQFHYIGLKEKSENGPDPIIVDMDRIFESFYSAVLLCRQGVRRDRWRSSLETLTSDPVFLENNTVEIALSDISEDELKRFFNRLSSGHKIILLTITRLVATIEERTLVLLDEPEAHLHPPLLSAFIRSLSNLLVNRNGVAVVATHSPVVLQEVPSSCAHLIYRTGTEIEVLPPESPTFGEGIGQLTSDVFQYEVTDSGFHSLINQVAHDSESYEQALAEFDEEIGGLAKAILLGKFYGERNS